ncbi:hypothetical protein BDV96DRAFT_496208 [Lophiotrema nucula]|uniref:Ergosterol biosynthesis protein-like protein n=1 Tax=Lophiotrema nucula TaxID=690887 RepID=A0A6A5Z3F1_9PLEO|nr:hypothetical protein BDV96DRAFT_496208 [Lophiotrema nucula]
MASTITSYLPPHEGWLPKWLLFVSIVSIGNSIQAYTTLHYTYRVYNPNHPRLPPSISHSTSPTTKSLPTDVPSQVTALSARKFGTWTFLTSLVRLYAAYNIDNKSFYTLAMWTYGIAWVHFMSEWFVFKTARWGAPLAGPVVVANMSLVWMWLQWGFYVNN